MSLYGQMNTAAWHQRATVTPNSRREAVRSWADLELIKMSLFPKAKTVLVAAGLEIECDAAGYVCGDLDIKPATADGTRDRVWLSTYAYEVIGVWDVGNRGLFKKLALRRVA